MSLRLRISIAFLFLLAANCGDPNTSVDPDNNSQTNNDQTNNATNNTSNNANNVECTGDCGECQTLSCDSNNDPICEGPSVNACGGCEILDAAPGDSCEECGTVVCESEDVIGCDLSTCPVCEPPDGPCSACSVSFSQCVDDEVICNTDACFAMALGEACSEDDTCASLNCANEVCSPAGFVFVPAATFTMGAPLDEPGLHPGRENGQHQVTLTRSLFVKATTVTQGEWSALYPGSFPSYFENCGSDCPVERINLYEMFKYANDLSAAEGLEECYNLVDCNDDAFGTGCPSTTRGGLLCSNTSYICDELMIEPSLDCDGYRLPTESEWEYFARAGTQTAYVTASGLYDENELDQISWYMNNSQVTYETDFNCEKVDARLDCALYPADQFYGTHPVAMKAPNNWGIYDVTGNVWERTWDIRDDYPAPGSDVTDPTGPDITANQSRAIRGGTFNAEGQYLRVAYRTGPFGGSRIYNTGFRLVRSIIP